MALFWLLGISTTSAGMGLRSGHGQWGGQHHQRPLKPLTHFQKGLAERTAHDYSVAQKVRHFSPGQGNLISEKFLPQRPGTCVPQHTCLDHPIVWINVGTRTGDLFFSLLFSFSLPLFDSRLSLCLSVSLSLCPFTFLLCLYTNHTDMALYSSVPICMPNL